MHLSLEHRELQSLPETPSGYGTIPVQTAAPVVPEAQRPANRAEARWLIIPYTISKI